MVTKHGRPCKVCSHPDHNRIDALLIDNVEPISKLSESFGIQYGAIRRHKLAHLPLRLVAVKPEIVQASQDDLDRAMMKLVVASKTERLGRLQDRWNGLQKLIAERAAAGSDLIPGSRTGLLAIKVRTIMEGKNKYTRVYDAEFDREVIHAELAIHKAVALETGEALTQAGKAPNGIGVTLERPLVIVVPAMAMPGDVELPDRPADANYRIGSAQRRNPNAAPNLPPTPPASSIDIETVMTEALDTREPAFPGVQVEDHSTVPKLELRPRGAAGYDPPSE